jgi:hypothetical protein
MTTPANPSHRKPAGDDRNLVPVDENYPAVTFEDKVHRFWKNYRMPVVSGCALVVVGLLAKGAWDRFEEHQELDVEKAYAVASTPEQLKAFSAAHSDHELAAIAQLRLADDAYAAGKPAEALAGYEKAAAALRGDPLGARAQLGRAMSKLQAGKPADGINELTQLAGDANLPKAVRVEAMYQLASLAADEKKSADVQKYSEQLMQLDPQSPWTQRAFMLRSSLPPPAEPAPAAPPAKDEPLPALQLKMPGK